MIITILLLLLGHISFNNIVTIHMHFGKQESGDKEIVIWMEEEGYCA
jgi:hypothetical protein